MRSILSTIVLTLLLGGLLTAQTRTSEVRLRIAQEKTAPGTGIRIKFLNVAEDSRCPTDVNCIWAGVARIKVRLRKNGKAVKDFELNTNQTDKAATFEGHEIKLVSLTPHPRSGGVPVKPNTYFATLTIAKLPM